MKSIHDADAVNQVISAKVPFDTTQETVDVVMATDANYLPFCSVTLSSLLTNYNDSRELRVFLLVSNQLKPEERNSFEHLKTIHDFSFNEIIVKGEDFANLRTTEGISIATYFRLAMHKCLPLDCQKVVYLDSDIVIEDSISIVFDTDMQNDIFAGVEDSISSDYNGIFGMPPGAPHINAGVLVVNVSAMRVIEFDKIIQSYLAVNRFRLTLGDQQIINEIFYSRIKLLNVRWNLHGNMFHKEWTDSFLGIRNRIDSTEYLNAIENPAVIHYTLKQKPWLSLGHPKSERWYFYLDKTIYKEIYHKEAKFPTTSEKEIINTPTEESKRLRPKKKSGNFIKRFNGYIKSIRTLRENRLLLKKTAEDLSEVNDRLNKEIAKKYISSDALSPLQEEDKKLNALNYEIKALQLNEILRNRANKKIDSFFRASEFVDSLQDYSTIFSNVRGRDVDGGYAENVKSLFKTNKIGSFYGLYANFIVLLSQRLSQDMFWDCLKTAALYDRDLYFMEVSFFGAFTGYFDARATAEERKCFGFIIDDLGYYFDARQPSRLETYLNNPTFQLTAEQRARASVLIQHIIEKRITKYNKYCTQSQSFSIKKNGVVVLDQKRGDASIEFAGADDERFQSMLEAAVRDNPGKPIYFKRHPDSIHRNMNSYRNRNIKLIEVLPDDTSIIDVIEQCSIVYTVSSQVGFEALLRGKKVVVFGFPFFAGWGLTDDRLPVPRRRQNRTIEDLFYVSCILLSVYLNPKTGQRMEIEDAFEYIAYLRAKHCQF